MNNHPTDHPDALIDRGLAELLGSETPPDLSDRILAAANALPSPTLTLAQSNAVNKKQREWKSLAILCASLAVIGTTVGLLLPPVHVARQSGRSSEVAKLEKSTTEQSQQSQDSDKLMMTVTPHIIIQEEEEEQLGIPTDEIHEKTAKQAESVRFYDPTEVQALLASKPEPNSDLYSQADKDKLEAEINAELQRRAASAPPEVVERYLQQRELARHEQGEDQASVPNQEGTNISVDERNFDWPARREKKAAIDTSGKTQSQHYYSDVDGELARQNRGEELRGSGRRFYINSGPGVQAGDHLTVTSTSPTVRLYRERESLGWQVYRDQYTPIHENPFIKADGPDAVSTFSIDVDTASYANVRQYLEQSRQLPPADAVRIEELINYFDYDYAGPTDDKPFAAHMEVASCPWNNEHRLARIAIKGKEIARDERPQSNLVFLVDVSGSMDEPNKLPLLVEGMKMLTRELGENDRVAIVVYASSEGMALPSTRGDQQETILAALDQLRAGGSTAGGAGINLAYSIALDNFIEGGTNRVILCTDGDFNVGVTDTAQLEHLAEQKAKTGVFLTVLGFGRGNLNDAMMEGISNKGNGNYHYVDNLTEARKVLVEEMAGTLVTIAKDVKIQVEFNPAEVAGYRLIGCENRLLKTEDFNNDKKDAGEIGAGHTVTALYEIIPAGQEVTPTSVDPLKYQQPLAGLADEPTKSTKITKPQAASDELLTLKLRYKLPDATKSTKLEFPITDSGESFADATDDFQFAAAVASFGMLLRHSQYQGETSFDAVQEIAQSSLGNDPHNYRGEFLELVRIAKELTTNQRE